MFHHVKSLYNTVSCQLNRIKFSIHVGFPSPSPQKFGLSLIHFGQFSRPNFRGEGSQVGEGSENDWLKPITTNYFATKLTIRSGTAISFKIVFPANSSAIFGSAFASASKSSLLVPRATMILDRNFPMI